MLVVVVGLYIVLGIVIPLTVQKQHSKMHKDRRAE